jgi:Tol biopolymer transport system component
MRRLRLGVLSLLVVAAALGLAAPASATTPGTNGRIVFRAHTDDGSSQLFLIGPHGHGLHQITHVNGDAVNPDWAPNGRWIAFELDTENGCSLVLIRPDGSNQRTLPHPPGAECDEQPAFTPAGGRLVFSSFNPTVERESIWVERLDGTHQRQLTPNSFGDATDPNLSPDGSQITVVAFNGQDLGQGLIRIGINGHHPELLLPYSTDVAIKHDWAPNGQRIVFTNNADNFDLSANIGTIRPDGTGVRWLTHYTDPEVRGYVGGYSADGHWIVFRLEDHGKYALMRMHPDGTHKRVILPLSDFQPRGIDWGASSTR